MGQFGAYATLTDDETVILGTATPSAKKRLASLVVAGGFDSLEAWLDSLGAPIVPPPPVDVDLQGLLQTLGPIPVGTVPPTRTQQALNLKARLDGGALTVEQAVVSVDMKVGAVVPGDLAVRTVAIRNALDASGVADIATGLQNIQDTVGDATGNGYLPTLGGDDLLTQVEIIRDQLDNGADTLNEALQNVQDKVGVLTGNMNDDVITQLDSAVDDLDATLDPVNRTIENALQVIEDMKAALGDDSGVGPIVGLPRNPGNYPTIDPVVGVPPATFNDAREIEAYLRRINN